MAGDHQESNEAALAPTTGDQVVGIWDARAGRSLERLALNAPYAHRVSWAPGGGFVAASLCGDRVRLWETRATLAAGS